MTKQILAVIGALTLLCTGHAADFNGDGKQDLVLYNPTTRVVVVWYMNGTTLIGGAYGPTLPAGWNYVAAADFNHDGHPDLLLFNPSTTQTAVWYLNGSIKFIGGAYGPTFNVGWYPNTASDLDYDGKMDIVAYRPATGQLYAVLLNTPGSIKGQFPASTIPSPWMLVGTAGFDVDRTNDLLLINPNTGQTADWLMEWNPWSSTPWYVAHGYYGPTIPKGYSLLGGPDLNNNGSSDYLLINRAQSVFWYLHINAFVGAAYGPVIPAGYYLADDVAKPCEFRITPTSKRALVGGGFGTILVGCNSSHCGWSAKSNASWIHVQGTFPQFGPNNVIYSVDANPGGARTGAITVAGLTYVVTQAGRTANISGTYSGSGFFFLSCGGSFPITATMSLSQDGAGNLSGHITLSNLPCADGACRIINYYSASSNLLGYVAGTAIQLQGSFTVTCNGVTDTFPETFNGTVSGNTISMASADGIITLTLTK
jgi:hypothetical protein